MPWNSPLHGRQRGWEFLAIFFVTSLGLDGLFFGDELGSVTIIVTIMLVDYHSYISQLTWI